MNYRIMKNEKDSTFAVQYKSKFWPFWSFDRTRWGQIMKWDTQADAIKRVKRLMEFYEPDKWVEVKT